MADAKSGSEAAALMEIAKMVNELRNSVLLLGLIIGKVDATPSQNAAAKARHKIEELARKESLI